MIHHYISRFFHFSSSQTIKEVDLQSLSSLEYLDLSRNLIGEIMPGTFLGMASLKGLDFSVNAVRKVCEDLNSNFHCFACGKLECISFCSAQRNSLILIFCRQRERMHFETFSRFG